MVIEVKKRQVLRILKDDRVATLKDFLIKIPKDKAKEVRINMKEDLRRVVEALFPEAKVVAAPLHIIADSNVILNLRLTDDGELMLKRISYGLRNAEAYWRKMLLGFVPCRSCFHNVWQRAKVSLTSNRKTK